MRLYIAVCLLIACTAGAATLPVDRAWTAVRGNAVPDGGVTHRGNKSLRVEAASTDGDAAVRSANIPLTIGKTYEVTGWVRTQDLTVRDTDRSPIASGATLSMASMPFDVHAESLAGNHDWTRLSLRFVASRSSDQIQLSAGNGGAFRGKAWFEGVSLDAASSDAASPAKDAVRTFGPAYRYPSAGWIYLHIEGKPYERGYQHGYLMSREIPEYLARCAYELGSKVDKQTWDTYRTSANALFLRGFDKEILEEMRGIADGANAAGAKWLGRKLDLIDIVLANTTVELGELSSAMQMTPTGIEAGRFDAPPYAVKHDSVTDHCSAFAATGPATRDGKMIIAHVTWWPQTLAEQTNVMLDIKPETGHRLLMQSYPGGIESGTDWYQNDAGMVLTETTIRQTPFDVKGTPVAFRARRAIQYAANVDEMVKELGTANNGLYTNEWLMGDGKNNEIAMYELGTSHTKLWRSSKDEWFGGTKGFYWGDNNAKDLSVSLEYLPDPHGQPEYIPFVPAIRDLAWQKLYQQNKGQIDEQFAFKAFDSAPLVSATTMDAKVATAEMANHMMVWGEFGRPNESVAVARGGDGPNKGLYPGGYALFSAQPSDSLQTMVSANEKARLVSPAAEVAKKVKPVSFKDKTDQLWKGWILPASGTDTWFAAGSANYYRVLQSADVDKAIDAERVRYRGLRLRTPDDSVSYRIESVKGTLFLDGLRQRMGDQAFLALMRDYFAANTTRTVTAQSFLDEAKVRFEFSEPNDGPAYTSGDIEHRFLPAAIVYGTAREAGTNRFAAEREQAWFRDRAQFEVPVYKDFEVNDEMLSHRDVIFIGRPDANTALAAWSERLGLNYNGAAFTLDKTTYASERNGLVFAAKNPLDASHMVVVFAGNSPGETARSINATGDTPWVVLEDGKPFGPSALPKE